MVGSDREGIYSLDKISTLSTSIKRRAITTTTTKLYLNKANLNIYIYYKFIIDHTIFFFSLSIYYLNRLILLLPLLYH